MLNCFCHFKTLRIGTRQDIFAVDIFAKILTIYKYNYVVKLKLTHLTPSALRQRFHLLQSMQKFKPDIFVKMTCGLVDFYTALSKGYQVLVITFKDRR